MPIFTKSGSFHEMAHVWPYREGWLSMPAAYGQAADELLEAALRGGGDLLVHPIAFLYRHAIELGLKELIYHARRFHDDGRGDAHGHNLAALWKRVRELMMEIAPEEASPGMDEVEAIIAELHHLDMRSDAFRYDDQRVADKLEGPVNLVALGETFRAVLSWLDGGVTMLDEWQAGP